MNNYLIWVTGLSGSGKTTIGNLIKDDIEKLIGKTIIIHGDDLRKLFNNNDYSKDSRLKLAKKYCNFCKYLLDQNINVIITCVALFHEIHDYNRKTFKNYIEIYIKSDIEDLIKRKEKTFYIEKTNNVWGLDISPELPKKPDIIIENNFNSDIQTYKNILLNKISKILE